MPSFPIKFGNAPYVVRACIVKLTCGKKCIGSGIIIQLVDESIDAAIDFLPDLPLPNPKTGQKQA